ncbi:MAG: EpsG family protein [Pseudomonadota bacterium]
MLQFVVVWAACPFLFEGSRRSRHRIAIRALLILLIAAACAFQPIESNSDRETYQEIIRDIAASDWSFDGLMEPGFYLLTKLLSFVAGDETLQFAVYFVVAVLSISLKLRLFSKIGGALDFYFLVFFAYFFLLQDATQIRAAVAVPLIYFAILAFLEHRRWVAIGCVVLASLFHYSGLLAFLIIPLLDRRGGMKFALVAASLALLGFVAVVNRDIYLAGFSALSGVVDLQKLQIYLDLLDQGVFEQINFLNRLAPHLVMLLSLLLLHRRWRDDPTMQILLQTYVIGILLFIVLSPFPILAYRISDIFLFAGILLAGRLSLHLRSKGVYRAFLILYSATFLIYAIGYSGIFIVDAS